MKNIIRNFVLYFQKLFGNRKSDKIYRNADLYQLLGQHYEKIMYYSFGRSWSYIKLSDNYNLVNDNLETDFKESDDLEKVLYKIKTIYIEQRSLSERHHFIEGKTFRESININTDDKKTSGTSGEV